MTVTPLTPMQRLTMGALRRGGEGRVPITLCVEARADSLLRRVAAAREQTGARVTPTAAIAHALASALRAHPAMNARLTEDQQIEQREAVALGIAVALADGELVVPVVRDAHALGLDGIGDAIADLAGRARERRLAPSELRGATFTLSSTGAVALPVLGSAALVSGQAGILLAGRIAQRPVAVGDRIVAGPVLPLSLTFDHLTVNGVPALRFLQTLVERIEDDG